MRVAIVHYWLVGMRGGEKVLEELCRVYPQADIYTHVVDPAKISAVLARHHIGTTAIARLPLARRFYKYYLPLMPRALEQLDLRDYDLVISSESGPAKGVITMPETLHVCYCHSPMRYLWNMYHDYLAGKDPLTRSLMAYFFHGMRVWDVLSAARVDHFIANAENVARRIAKYYRRDATVICPPVDVASFRPAEALEPYYLFCGQLVGYKRADLAIAAFNRLAKRLVVIGDGEELAKLRKAAGPTIEFLGWQPGDRLRHHLARCQALIFPGEEDFGIVPVEAMASGRPVIALKRGGVLETVEDEVTGILFDEPSVDALCAAIASFERAPGRFVTAELVARARLFGPERFRDEVTATIERLLLERRLGLPETREAARIRDVVPVMA